MINDDSSRIGDWQSRHRKESNLAENYSSNKGSESMVDIKAPLPRPEYKPFSQMNSEKKQEDDNIENQEDNMDFEEPTQPSQGMPLIDMNEANEETSTNEANEDEEDEEDDEGDGGEDENIENNNQDSESDGGEEGEGGDNNSDNESSIGAWRSSVNSSQKSKLERFKESANKAFKQGTKRLYDGSWKGLIDSFGATILYLWLHFWIKYVGSFNSFSKFGNPLKSSEIKDLISGEDDKTDYGWMLIFIFLSFVVLAILVLVAVILYILVKSYTISKTELFFSAGKGWIIGGKEGSFEAMIEYILRH